MDALSELLRVVKLSGALFIDARCRAPWCVRSPPAEKLRCFVPSAGSCVVEFHLVTRGRGYIRVGGESTPLEPGDVAILPHGDSHVMGNGHGAPEIDGEPSLSRLLQGELLRPDFGHGQGEETHLVCGYLSGDAALLRPALAGLPRVLRIPLRTDDAGRWLEGSIVHALSLAARDAPGSDVMRARLAELLFAEALRRYVMQQPPGRAGWLAGAADSAVGRVLACLHRDPGRDWTLDELAAVAALSRSALTERFARFLGTAPMAYLAEWRLELAAEALRTTRRSVLQLAAEVGYGSEAAFNRAFKRRYGQPPAQYRRDLRRLPTARPDIDVLDTEPAR